MSTHRSRRDVSAAPRELATVSLLVATACLVGCDGSSTTTDGSAGAGGAGGQGGVGGQAGGGGGKGGGAGGGSGGGAGTDASGDGAKVACGAMSCGAGQICVMPCISCGGAVPPCEALADGGACPAGFVGCTTDAGAPGCIKSCLPPPPTCVDPPSSCAATPTCDCLASAIDCASGSCTSVVDRQVACYCPPVP